MGIGDRGVGIWVRRNQVSWSFLDVFYVFPVTKLMVLTSFLFYLNQFYSLVSSKKLETLGDCIFSAILVDQGCRWMKTMDEEKLLNTNVDNVRWLELPKMDTVNENVWTDLKKNNNKYMLISKYFNKTE